MPNIAMPTPGNSTESPFDAIKRAREDGTEYWSARDLAPLMGYESWQKFDANVIRRAKAAATNQNMDVTSHFTRSGKTPAGGGPLTKDYELSRFAAYLTAMNGDPNKPEVAAAQAYFAIQTHVAETQTTKPALPQDYASALRALAESVEQKELEAARAKKAEAELKSAAPKVEYHDKFVAAESDVISVGDWGAHYGLTRPQAFNLLRDAKLIYKKTAIREFSAQRGHIIDRNEWRAYAKHRDMFDLRAQHNAPRYHNGQVRQTLYIKTAHALDVAAQVGLGDVKERESYALFDALTANERAGL